jgi:alpha-1,3-mannosyl-glycoprotein beta-1,2-N-acetylglucosaminyltransferase
MCPDVSCLRLPVCCSSSLLSSPLPLPLPPLISGQFFNEFLASIRLNDKAVDWAATDVSYVASPKRYDVHMAAALSAATGVAAWSEVVRVPAASSAAAAHSYALTYGTLDELTGVLAQIGLMTDHKEKVPRTSYRGVVSFRFNGHQIYLRPSNWAKLFLDPIS